MRQHFSGLFICFLVLLNASFLKGYAVPEENEIVDANVEEIEESADEQETRASCQTSMGANRCMKFSTGCYCFVNQQKSWQQAFGICRDSGKALLSLNSLTKQVDIQKNVQSLVGTGGIVSQIGLWTSGTYLTSLKGFWWASAGQMFSFNRWQMFSPKNQGSNDCVRLIPTDNSYWADLDCGQYLPFICESEK